MSPAPEIDPTLHERELDFEPGMVGAHWARLQAAAIDVPESVRSEIAQVLNDLEPTAPAAERVGWPQGPSFFVAVDTLRALIGLPVHDSLRREQEEGAR